MNNRRIFLWMIVLSGMLFACKAPQNIIYMQQAGKNIAGDSTINIAIPDPVIKTGDVLMITVNTNTPESALPFNLPLIPAIGETGRSYNLAAAANLSSGLGMQNYIVDSEGYLNFPVVGNIKVRGLTKSQLIQKIKTEIYPKYLKEEPIILMRYGNFRVSVLGEVARPGTFAIDNEKVSLLEALALAGDLTIYGSRNEILLIRENGLNRETVKIDLRDKFLVNSPYYFLQQGDVIYVQPNKTKARTSQIGAAETLSISIVSTLISFTTLVVSLLR